VAAAAKAVALSSGTACRRVSLLRGIRRARANDAPGRGKMHLEMNLKI
jgi:hypothetical protein